MCSSYAGKGDSENDAIRVVARRRIERTRVAISAQGGVMRAVIVVVPLDE
jgi:hypothetical protein